MASLSLDRFNENESFYTIDIFWATRIIYAISLGADQILLHKGTKGEWNGSFQVGQKHFQIAKRLPSEPAADEGHSLLSLFEEDALWQYTKTNGSAGHRSIIIYPEVIDMWIWKNPNIADYYLVSLTYNANAKKLASSIIKNSR